MHQAAFVCETHRAGCPDFQVGDQDLLAHSALVAEGAPACAFVAVQAATMGHEVVLGLDLDLDPDLEVEAVESDPDLEVEAVVESDLDLVVEVDPDLGPGMEW